MNKIWGIIKLSVIVITGGTSGIGRLAATSFENAGHTVIVLARSAENGERSFACDVSDIKRVTEVFTEIGKRFGQIDVLINNAGYGLSGATELIPNSEVQNLMDVNVMGVVNCTQNALPYMKQGSKIINIGSAMAFFPLPFRTMYAAGKSAVVTLSMGWRLELEKAKIDVSVLCPGDVKTNFTKARKKFNVTNAHYGSRVANSTAQLDAKENKRMPASMVVVQLQKQVARKKSKLMVIVGFKYKVLYVLQKIVPLRLKLWATQKFIGKQ